MSPSLPCVLPVAWLPGSVAEWSYPAAASESHGTHVFPKSCVLLLSVPALLSLPLLLSRVLSGSCSPAPVTTPPVGCVGASLISCWALAIGLGMYAAAMSTRMTISGLAMGPNRLVVVNWKVGHGALLSGVTAWGAVTSSSSILVLVGCQSPFSVIQCRVALLRLSTESLSTSWQSAV